MHSLYLLVNLFSVIVPFIYSFHPRLQFYRKWNALVIAFLISCLFFIVWDIQFTKIGVWGFNPTYVTGIYFFNLPIEEVLFFLCIPYACTFTYHSLKQILWKEKHNNPVPVISLVLGAGLIIFSLFQYERLYTFYSCLLNGIFLIVFRNKIEKAFYYAYLILLIPFFIVNGILTGTGLDAPVVWYNNNENLSLRLFTIPIEDTVYGMLMIFMNLLIFNTAAQYFSKRKTAMR